MAELGFGAGKECMRRGEERYLILDVVWSALKALGLSRKEIAAKAGLPSDLGRGEKLTGKQFFCDLERRGRTEQGSRHWLQNSGHARHAGAHASHLRPDSGVSGFGHSRQGLHRCCAPHFAVPHCFRAQGDPR